MTHTAATTGAGPSTARIEIAGARLRVVAAGSALVLAMFGLAMAISFGLKEPLDYSVFSASAAALLLAVWPEGA